MILNSRKVIGYRDLLSQISNLKSQITDLKHPGDKSQSTDPRSQKNPAEKSQITDLEKT